jgi:hypothetical protein
MTRRFPWQFALLSLLAPGLIRGAEAWTRLKLGMSADDAVAVLGEPLIRATGKGFELWIYDHDAEALFYGPLIGWTTPTEGDGPVHCVDVWQPAKPGADQPVFFLPRPILTKNPVHRRAAPAEGENKLPFYRVRR